MPRKSATPSLADADPAPGGVAAVDRAVSLLAAFRAGDQALGLAELAQRSGLYKSTVLRLLASLEHASLVQRLENGSYVLGTEIARLHGVYSRTFSLDRLVMPVLRELVERTGESASYSIVQGDARLCLYRVDSPHPVRDHVRPGDLLPLKKGAGGRVLIAFDPALCGKLGKDEAALYARIRREGVHASRGDRLTEVAGISAPVFGARGAVAASLTVSMPVHRYKEAYVALTKTAAQHLTGLMASARGDAAPA